MSQPTFQIRRILPEDNEAVANLIRTVMSEFGAVGEGYSIMDPEVSQMYQSYASDRAAFFVLTKDHEIVGCGGINELQGADDITCELRKMYFYPEARGLGFGKELLVICLDAARQIGYRYCYLETIHSMNQAARLYKQAGFQMLDQAIGNTGHTKCNSWYLKEL